MAVPGTATYGNGALTLRLARGAAMLVGALGLAAQLGAATGITVLASIIPGGPQMAVSTGLCFLATALATALLVAGQRSASDADVPSGPGSGGRRWLIGALGAGVLLTGLTVLGLYALHGPPPAAEPGMPPVARMAPATALGFVLAGSAVLLATLRRHAAFQILCLLTVMLGWLGVSRYLYGGAPLSILTAMSLNTALAFMVSGIGLLCTQPTRGVMELLLSRSDGGTMIRCMLPFIVALPPSLGYLRLQLEQAGWYGAGAGLSLFSTINISAFSVLAWIYARRLHAADLERAHQATLAQHLAQVVASSEDAIISQDLAGRIVSWNAGAQQLYGYTAAEAIGMPRAQLLPPAQRERAAQLVRNIIAGVSVENEETIHQHRDGTPLDVLRSVSPIRDAGGALVGIAHIVRDNRERVRAAARIHASLARLDLLRQVTQAVGEHHDLASIYQVVVGYLEKHMPVDFAAVCLYDRNSHTLVASYLSAKSIPYMQGQSAKERLSFAIADNGLAKCVDGVLVYEPDLGRHAGPMPRRLAGAGLHSLVAAPMQVESVVRGVILIARTAPNAFSSGECEFLSQLGAHVALATRHAEIHTALESAYNDLRQTQQAVMQHERLRALGQMASGIAHDINNSLSPVLLYAERILAKETGLTERGRNDVKTIMRAGDDIAATVARLREFYRQQGQVGKMAGADLNQLVAQVLDLTKVQWRDTAQQRGITITTHHEAAAGLPYVLAVESELREALTNLTLNAIDAMPQGGSLTFRTRVVETAGRGDGVPSGRAVQIDISDTGVGMDEQVRLRCLEPFYTTKGERGTGLGLAMVYGIVQRHGGELAIDSAPGRGTTFTLTFFNLTLSRTPSVQELSGAPRRLRLLLVDDDPIIIKALSDALSDDGHELVLANGGQAGIAAFHASVGTAAPIDLVITDLGMPQVDGRRVAEAVKAAAPHTPVLMLTGWGQRLNDDEQLPANVDLVLSKPPKLHEIRTALHRLCAG